LATRSFARFGGLGFYTETSLHCGTESGAGYVDLPVQRERHTQYPVIPGSTIKGVLRDELFPAKDPATERVFGKEDATSPGTVSFQDGVLVAFPVRSSGAPFRWVTCPFALNRILRAMGEPDAVPQVEKTEQAWGATAQGEIALEELVVTVAAGPKALADALPTLLRLLPGESEHFKYVRDLFSANLLVVHDEVFKELTEVGTEVVTRIQLNSVGTTAKHAEGDSGNLFVEELVPPDTLFFAALRAPGEPDKAFVQAIRKQKIVRVGGDETIGRGVTHMTYIELGG
jgi:CRISPR-associated protein Cmr4